MEQKDTLLKSLIALKSAHEEASKLMSEITISAAKAAKGGDTLPSLAELRRYKQALAVAKLHASQAEMMLADGVLSRIPAQSISKPVYLQ